MDLPGTSASVAAAPRRNTQQTSSQGGSRHDGLLDNTLTELRYNKTTGADDMAGELFEVKMLALIFLRLVGAGAEFAIASNMKEAGMFDDIVVKSRTSPQDPWKTTLLQLKNKNYNPPSRSLLLGLEDDFSLIKFCDSYFKIRNDKGLKFFGNVDDLKFIIFTNLGLGCKIGKKVEAEELFNTGGQAVCLAGDDDILNELCEWADFKFALEELRSLIAEKTEQEAVRMIRDKMNSLRQFKNKPVNSSKDALSESPTFQNLDELLKILEPVQDREIITEFLGKLQFYTKQTHEKNLDALIKEELSRVWMSNAANTHLMFNTFLESIKSWRLERKVLLQPNSQFWQDLIKTKIDKLSRISVLEEFGIDFEKDHLKRMLSKILHLGVIIVSVDSLTTVTAIKVMRAFAIHGGNVLHVDLATLLEREDEVLAAWSSRWCDRLVIECSTDLDIQQISRLTQNITNVVCNNEIKLVLLISKKTHSLRSKLIKTDCVITKVIDKCEWNNLTKQAQNNLLSKRINIQGAQIALSELVDDKYLSKVNLETMSCMLQKDLRCGNNIKETGKFYIPRRLGRSGVTLSINSVNDVSEPVVIVGADPGMGKTTLLQQLARSAKQVDPCWTLQIQLCDCTELLQAVNPEELTLVKARELLGQFAFDTGHSLEKTLFKNWKHDVCVFVDGVDEVCPHYETQIMALLKCFRDLKFKNLWVASRPICVPKLEVVLGVKCFDLVHFSDDDQATCISSVWTSNSQDNSDEDSDQTPKKLLKVLKQVLGIDNPILGVPLITVIIAEKFASFPIPNKEKYPLKTDIYDLIYVLNFFVRKIFDIHYDEKKQMTNRQLVANVDEVERNWLLFLHNHKLAALSVLFSPAEISALKFDDKDKFAETLATFCKEIAEGRERTGIIDNISKAGVPRFLHQKFAEFFATTWLVQNYPANPEITRRIIFNKEFRLMSDMFNSFLTSWHPLQVAVKNRDRAAIKLLLRDQFISPETAAKKVDNGGRSVLHLAVFYSVTTQHPEYIDLVKYFLALKVPTNLPDRVLGWRPWQYAEHAEAWPLMGLLLANADAEELALVKAVKEQSLSVFLAYLAQESVAPPDSSVMLSLAKNAVVSVVRFLVEERGGDVFCRGQLGVTSMHRAAEGGNIDVMKYLAGKSVSLFTENHENATPMHYAALNGHYQAIEFIAKHDSSQRGNDIVTAINGKYSSSFTTPSILPMQGLDIVKYLFSIGVCIGDKLLHVACSEDMTEVVSFLLQNGADIEAANDLGQTSLHLASQQGHVNVVDALLKKGAGQTGDKDGDYPLHVAVRAGKLDVVKILMAQKCEVDARNTVGQTALLVACKEMNLDAIKMLVAGGACIVASVNGLTSLHIAAQGGKADVAAYLIEKFDDINVLTNKGQTAIWFASKYGHLDFVRLLVAKGASMVGDEDGWTPLHIAAKEGKADVVAYLIEKVKGINIVTNMGQTPLYLACSEGHLDVVKLFMAKGGSMVGDLNGWTLFHIAAQAKKADVVAYLIEKVDDINVVTSTGKTALWIASYHGHLDVVKLLVAKGASMVGCKNGMTPLHKAAQKRNLDVVAYLIEKVDDVNIVTSTGKTALWIASYHGHLDVVKLLVAKGASMVGAEYGLTPLHIAAQKRNADVVAYLIEKVDKINVVNNTGQTALSFASYHGHLDVVKLLVTKGASMVGDKDGMTPLHIASVAGRADVVAYLIEKVDDINVLTKTGKTALHIASYHGHLDVVKLLVAKGASMVADIEGYYPLHIAAQEGKADVVDYLIEKVGDINVGTNKGLTALWIASYNGHLDVVKLLFANGASMVGGINGFYPFHIAAQKGHADVVAYLIEKVKCIDDVTSTGKTALYIASMYGHLDVVKLLVAKGASMVGDEDKTTPWHIAAQEGKADVVAYLIEKVEDVNFLTKTGETALYKSSCNGHLDVVKLLVAKGASMVGVNDGRNPLHIAAQQGHADVVDYLIEKLGFTNVVNETGKTALHIASWYGHLDVVKLLVAKGASMVGDEDGKTPWHMAAQGGRADVVIYLIGKLDDINEETNTGKTAFYLASYCGHLSIVKLLVAKGANMVGDKDGWTPLHAAAQGGNADVVAYLIEIVSDINVVTDAGQTALLIASYHGYLDVVKLLVAKGISNVGNVNGWTPLHFAAQEGKADVVAYLIENGGDINILTNTDETALLIASFQGHLDVVKLLVVKRASMAGNVNGWTPLHFASQEGKADVVAYLIENFVDLNVKTNSGETALELATRRGHQVVVDILAMAGVQIMDSSDTEI